MPNNFCEACDQAERALETQWLAETAHLSAQAAADELNRRGLAAAYGKSWHAMQVYRVRQRLGI